MINWAIFWLHIISHIVHVLFFQKLAVGAAPEKIITAFHLVHDENAAEDTALNNCEGAFRRFGDLERDIESQGKETCFLKFRYIFFIYAIQVAYLSLPLFFC